MLDKAPLVSIGMPLYNEERFLARTLDSVLSQYCNDFEIIIVDNASTDSTADICIEYQKQERRIRYYRNEENLGAVQSFNRSFELSSGKYLVYVAGHDLWAPDYLSKCVEVLENDPQAVLCYTQAIVIDVHGMAVNDPTNRTVLKSKKGIDIHDMNAYNRFRAALWTRGVYYHANAIYGVLRSDALRRAGLFQNVLGPDDVILLKLSILGAFVQIKEPLYYWRLNRDDPPTKQIGKQEYFERLDPRNLISHKTPLALQTCQVYFPVVWNSPFTMAQKVRLTVDVLRIVFERLLVGSIFRNLVLTPIRWFAGERGVNSFKKFTAPLARRYLVPKPLRQKLKLPTETDPPIH